MMSFSSYYHLFSCESHDRANFLRCFDMVGICIMILGSATPPFYYGFMCDENRLWGRIFLGLLWFFCLMAMFLTLYLRNRRDLKYINAIAYVLASYSVIPGAIYLLYYSKEALALQYEIWPWTVGGYFYVGGAILFATNIPERLLPESRFIATWVQSHTIFHVCILVAAILHFWASLRIFHER